MVEDELGGIIRSGRSSRGVLEGKIYLNSDFTWKAMKKGLEEGYPLVHIASHFNMAPGNDTMSFLLLGDGGHLTMDEVRRSQDLFKDVDLLTLSACNTAMGNIGENGREVECFGVLAQQQGAKAIVATLWPVADESTSWLMREFYRKRTGGMPKAEALRQAQVGLLKGDIKADRQKQPRRGGSTELERYEYDPDAPFAHPFFWAPYILIGNWQ